VIRALVGSVTLVLLAAGGAAAASFTLDDGARQAALKAGERSTLVEGFDHEWRVNGDGGETLTVLTPFHRLLLAARNATFKNNPLKPAEIERAVKQDAQRLIVWVHLRGRSEDFARHYVPRLLDGTRDIKATFVQNERTAPRQDDGAYVARCVYGFPIRDLTGNGRVELAVADSDGRDVSRFTIDLSKMR
jgi:hypothetical protein